MSILLLELRVSFFGNCHVTPTVVGQHLQSEKPFLNSLPTFFKACSVEALKEPLRAQHLW